MYPKCGGYLRLFPTNVKEWSLEYLPIVQFVVKIAVQGGVLRVVMV